MTNLHHIYAPTDDIIFIQPSRIFFSGSKLVWEVVILRISSRLQTLSSQKVGIYVTHVGVRKILEIDINHKNLISLRQLNTDLSLNFDLSGSIKLVSRCINASFYIQLINGASDISAQIVFMLQILHFLGFCNGRTGLEIKQMKMKTKIKFRN